MTAAPTATDALRVLDAIPVVEYKKFISGRRAAAIADRSGVWMSHTEQVLKILRGADLVYSAGGHYQVKHSRAAREARTLLQRKFA